MSVMISENAFSFIFQKKHLQKAKSGGTCRLAFIGVKTSPLGELTGPSGVKKTTKALLVA
jgi:hypothetical protein